VLLAGNLLLGLLLNELLAKLQLLLKTSQSALAGAREHPAKVRAALYVLDDWGCHFAYSPGVVVVS